MSHMEILKASGFEAAEITGGTLSVSTPVDGSEIAKLAEHSVSDANAMIHKAHEAFLKWRKLFIRFWATAAYQNTA